MKASISAAAIVTVLAATGATHAAPSLALQKGTYVNDGASSLSVDFDATPTVVDWNNDGRKDLVAGQYTSGHIRLYLNQGTDTAPLFSGYSLIESDGSPITTSYG